MARKLAVRTVVAWFGELSFEEQSSALAQLQDQHDESRAAKRSELQKQLAALIKKDDGRPISPQYLNDLEHDRRHPPSEVLLSQFARGEKSGTCD